MRESTEPGVIVGAAHAAHAAQITHAAAERIDRC
jgi:hypothetical protein